MTKSGMLPAKQTAVIAALLESRGVKEAAEKTGVPVRTVYRWLQTDTAFTAALQAAESQLMDSAMRRLLTLQGDALDALQAVLLDVTTPPAVRVAAAGKVLDNSLKLYELRTMAARLTAVEQALGVNDGDD